MLNIRGKGLKIARHPVLKTVNIHLAIKYLQIRLYNYRLPLPFKNLEINGFKKETFMWLFIQLKSVLTVILIA